jgi:hypothetical protein
MNQFTNLALGNEDHGSGRIYQGEPDVCRLQRLQGQSDLK